MLIKVKIFSLKINDRSNLRGYVFHFHDIAQNIMIDNSNKYTKKLKNENFYKPSINIIVMRQNEIRKANIYLFRQII